MKNHLFNFGSLILISGVFLSSCTKDNLTADGKLTYKIKPANFTASIGPTASESGLVIGINSNSSLTWTSGNLNLSELDFEAESKNSGIEYELKQAFNVDLFNLSSVLGSITLPDATYEEVELKLVLRKSTTSNIPLTLKGVYTDATGAKIPVEFYFNEDFEAEVEAENLVVSGTNDYLGLINVQLNKFLTNVVSADLGGAAKTNGVIVISPTSNMELYAKLKSNLNLLGDCDFED